MPTHRAITSQNPHERDTLNALHDMTDSENGSLAISEDLVQSPTHKPASTTTLEFNGLLTTPLRLHEDLADGCGGQLWPAGIVLAKYILRQHKNNLKGKTMFVRSRYPHYQSAHKATTD